MGLIANWFSWLFAKESKKNEKMSWQEECLLFVQGLAEAKTPQIEQSLMLGYLLHIRLYYNDIFIKLTYNTVRHEWELRIWSGEVGSFLFYHDCLDESPLQAINYLVKKYDLSSRVRCAVEQMKKEELEKTSRKEDIIMDYIKHKTEQL